MKSFKKLIEEAASSSELADGLREMIDHIYEMESEGLPDGEDEGSVAEVGLDIISEIADRLPEDVITDIMDALAEYYDLNADYGDEGEGEEGEEGEVDESLVVEKQTAKQHKLMSIKADKKAALGDKADTMDFKRKYFFDTKKKKFVKRDKALSVATIKKKAKIFKKILKKASTKLAAAKTRKKFDK